MKSRLEDLYAEWDGWVRAIAAQEFGITGEDQDDFAQDVWLRVLRGLPRYKDNGTGIQPWLKTVIWNRGRQFARKRHNWERRAVPLDKTVRAVTPSPEDDVLERVDSERRARAMRAMWERG